MTQPFKVNILNLNSRCGMSEREEEKENEDSVDAVTEVTYLSESDMDEVPPIVKETIGSEYLKGVGKLPNRLLILIDLKRVLNSEEMNRLQPA